MIDDQRPGTVYWIDHYVLGTDDTDRWMKFQDKIVGGVEWPTMGAETRKHIVFADITPCCHHGSFVGFGGPLPPSNGLGKGGPRHALFIRPTEIDEHLRRLDQHQVPHLDPVRVTAEGAPGTAIYWEDVDHNQMEFWAPDHMPDGAMDFTSPFKVGRISHCVLESRDLQRTADFFNKYCMLEPMQRADIPSDTLVLPTAGGARIIYKKVDTLSQRTGGWGKLPAVHDALVIRDADFWDSYERMWAELPDWEWSRETKRFVGGGPDLPARTSRHGSAAGGEWYDIRGRGDDWYDWDTNSFHFLGGVPRGGSSSLTTYEPHLMDWHLEKYKEAHGISA